MTNQSRIEYGNYIVVFIDILGQKEQFSRLDKYEIVPPDFNPTLESELFRLHQDTAMYVTGLRDVFGSFFDIEKADREVPSVVPADQVESFKEARKSKYSIKYFSDCLQISISLKTDKWHSNAVNAVYTALVACGGAMIWSLAQGKVLRAGIDLGIGIQIQDDEIYGPALFKAYHLESKIADYPRIVIGHGVYNYLANLSVGVPQQKGQKTVDIEICKGLAEKIMSFIKKDYDDILAVDYLCPEFIENTRQQMAEGYQLMIDRARQFIDEQYERFKSEKNEKLEKRYAALKRYLQAGQLPKKVRLEFIPESS